ncbi:MAG: hypothetical protein IT158_17120 [Bryobacterales bacterium]|nr:hypothetical protein [Bryobacterales bacterium]
MSRFLRFVVEQALAGRGSELKEYLVGVEVFDRGEGYDPRVDPIVRVEARRLRSKLSAYYESEGAADPVRIDLPTGRYCPRFSRPGARTSHPVPGGSGAMAVLPFVNLSSEPDNDYFSDGLTQELIHALTKVEGLRVVAWNSAVQLKSEAHDFRRIREHLNASRVLTGSVRRAGGQLRITAQLIETATGVYIWSESYDRQMEDLFAVQGEISRAIVRALRMKLAAQAGAAAPSNLEAYNLYLRGRYYASRRTTEGLDRSTRCFAEAVRLDPDFALGYAGLADSYTLLAEYGAGAPVEMVVKALAAARRALEIDPTLAEANSSLGCILSVYEWQWREAERHFLRAIELNPGYVTAHHWYGSDHLAFLGRFDQAMEELEVARQLDPLSAILIENCGMVHMMKGQFDRAMDEYRKVLDLDPYFYKGYTAMGRVRALQGRYDEAVELLEKGWSLGGEVPSIISALGQVHGAAGRAEEARACLARLEQMSRRRYVPSTCFAIVYLGLGESSRVLDHLEMACERHDIPLASIGVHPIYQPLRGHPRFQQLLRRVGLAGVTAAAP